MYACLCIMNGLCRRAVAILFWAYEFFVCPSEETLKSAYFKKQRTLNYQKTISKICILSLFYSLALVVQISLTIVTSNLIVQRVWFVYL